MYGSREEIYSRQSCFPATGRDCKLLIFDEQGSGGVILVLNAGPEFDPGGDYQKGKHENTCTAYHFLWVRVAQKQFHF